MTINTLSESADTTVENSTVINNADNSIDSPENQEIQETSENQEMQETPENQEWVVKPSLAGDADKWLITCLRRDGFIQVETSGNQKPVLTLCDNLPRLKNALPVLNRLKSLKTLTPIRAIILNVLVNSRFHTDLNEKDQRAHRQFLASLCARPDCCRPWQTLRDGYNNRFYNKRLKQPIPENRKEILEKFEKQLKNLIHKYWYDYHTAWEKIS